MNTTLRILARLTNWTCFFCGQPTSGSGSCTNCGV